MKAIAIFDGMPKNCKECCVRINIESSKAISFCALTGLLLKISELDVIDGMCPLRPFPERKKHNLRNEDEYEVGSVDGWNYCLDEILGEEIEMDAKIFHSVDELFEDLNDGETE